MTQQRAADTLPLVFIDHGERDLGRSRSHDDVASATDDCSRAPFFNRRDQSDMIDEIDVREEFDFLFRKVAFRAEETALQRLRAGAVHGVEKLRSIVCP
jgi:hypothetical protein